LTRLFN